MRSEDKYSAAITITVSAAAGNGAAVHNERNRFRCICADGAAAIPFIVAVFDGPAIHMEAGGAAYITTEDGSSPGNGYCTALASRAIPNNTIIHIKQSSAINIYATRNRSPVHAIINHAAVHIKDRFITNQLHAAGLSARTGIPNFHAVIHIKYRRTVHVYNSACIIYGGKNEFVFRRSFSLLGSQIQYSRST